MTEVQINHRQAKETAIDQPFAGTNKMFIHRAVEAIHTLKHKEERQLAPPNKSPYTGGTEQ